MAGSVVPGLISEQYLAEARAVKSEFNREILGLLAKGSPDSDLEELGQQILQSIT